jgi:hypothetical protein
VRFQVLANDLLVIPPDERGSPGRFSIGFIRGRVEGIPLKTLANVEQAHGIFKLSSAEAIIEKEKQLSSLAN